MDALSGSHPKMDWEATDLVTAWKSFQQHTEYVVSEMLELFCRKTRNELFHKNNFKQPLSERPDSSIKKRQILAAIKPSQRKRELKFQNKDIIDVPEDHSYSFSTTTIKHKSFPTYRDIGIQTDIDSEFIEQLETKLKKANENLKDSAFLLRDRFMKKVLRDDKSICFYTGFPSLHMFNGIFHILDSYEKKYEEREHLKPGPKRKLSRYHEYTVTMIRLRQALPEKMLADIFGVSVSRISQIFTTWIYYMKSILKDLVVWPSKALIKKHMPASFKKSYPNTTAVIDCTELFIQRPRNPTTQAKTFSTYKSHNTYKCLVSITPNGNFNYISDLYGGNTSDRYITEHSGFLDLVSAGDEIMADRGFRIRDLLLESRAYLTMPPFTRKCSWGKGKRLTAYEIRKTRKIANVRIYVEQAIQRMKKFKMLSQILLWTQKPLVYPMMIVAGFICNLMKPLANK
ncbi:unnamed protein product [Mytilus edulis]|uniref:DDE Tnp4 domain-containing protein n=1 Tax=Mytilus edulis TaxID=6550 RepID=A0A8S3SPX4_MYTED|nr:unnamed protein product [Mytilus edulis]